MLLMEYRGRFPAYYRHYSFILSLNHSLFHSFIPPLPCVYLILSVKSRDSFNKSSPSAIFTQVFFRLFHIFLLIRVYNSFQIYLIFHSFPKVSSFIPSYSLRFCVCIFAVSLSVVFESVKYFLAFIVSPLSLFFFSLSFLFYFLVHLFTSTHTHTHSYATYSSHLTVSYYPPNPPLPVFIYFPQAL